MANSGAQALAGGAARAMTDAAIDAAAGVAADIGPVGDVGAAAGTGAASAVATSAARAAVSHVTAAQVTAAQVTGAQVTGAQVTGAQVTGAQAESPADVALTELDQMRAVIHPARWRVLTALYDEGVTLTATDAARLTGLTPSAMSYHLRQLARAGLIEPGESSDGRARPWRAAGAGLRMTAQPDAVVGAALMRNLVASVTRAVSLGPPAPPDARPWPAGYTHARLRLTKRQAAALHERVRAAIREFTAVPEADRDPVFDYEVFWVDAAVGSAGSAVAVAHVDPAPEPVDPAPEPVDPAPGPVDAAPASVAPTDTAP